MLLNSTFSIAGPRDLVLKISRSGGASSMTSLPANRRAGLYSGTRPAHETCSPDGARARTENHPARLCEAIMAACGIGGRRVEATFAGMAGEAFPGSGPPADRALGRRLAHDTGSRPGLPVHRRGDRHLAGAPPEQRRRAPRGHARLREIRRSAGGELGIEFDRCHPPRDTDELRENCRVVTRPRCRRVRHAPPADGTRGMFEPPTVIYVNADARRLGMLILPLTVAWLRRS